MNALRPFALEITLGLALLSLILLVMTVALSARLARTSRLVRSLMTGPDGADLEAMLRGYAQRVQTVESQQGQVEAALSSLTAQLRGCVQNVGLVRFDAFGDVSGGQSFSVALLDGGGNGVVVTGLFGRSDSRCFGKSIRNGASEQALAQEEEQALEIALGRAPAQAFLGEPPVKGRGRRAAAARSGS
jgi:hypothetical protein